MIDPASQRVIYHLTTDEEWIEALAVGQYRRSTRGRSLDEVGYIHASGEDQVDGVAAFVYPEALGPESTMSLLLLSIDVAVLAAVGSQVRWEDGGDGEVFPHIYGPLPVQSVIAAEPWAAGAETNASDDGADVDDELDEFLG